MVTRGHVGLANMFKERDNPSKIGSLVGEVVSINPLKVSIKEGNILIDSSNGYIAKGLSLQVGDKVYVSTADDNQSFFILCEIEVIK